MRLSLRQILGTILGRHYISLDAARYQALFYARQEHNERWPKYTGEQHLWETLSSEEDKDNFYLVLSFKPFGRYQGEPGLENYILDKTGKLKVRLLLKEPTGYEHHPVPSGFSTEQSVLMGMNFFESQYSFPSRRDYCIQAAIECYDHAIELDPASTFAYSQRGDAHYRLGRHELALRDYDKCIDLNPNQAGLYYQRGSAYHDLSQYEQAIQDYDQTISLDPQYALAYGKRGDAHGSLGQHQRAIEDYDNAIKLEPWNAEEFYRKQGFVYEQLGQTLKAKGSFHKAGLTAARKKEYRRRHPYDSPQPDWYFGPL